jgi:predicted outer membrane repeat protein
VNGNSSLYHIVSGADNALIDGVTITNGDRNEDGAGLYSSADGIEISNCIFSSNDAGNGDGAAMYLAGESIVIENCTFTSNETENGDGGAIFLHKGTSATITNCSFKNNEVEGYGGAIYCDNAIVEIGNCSFSGNEVTARTGSGDGGAVYFTGGNVVVVNCNFANNDVAGSGTDQHGGAIHLEDKCTATISSSIFYGNCSCSGGAISCDMTNSTLEITNCVFFGNDADYGGAIVITDSDEGDPVTITNCSFSHNDADTASGGGAIYNYDESDGVTIINSILCDNDGNGEPSQIYNADTSECTVKYSLIEGDYSGPGNIEGDKGDVDFVNDSNSLNFDLHLKSSSVCRDEALGSLAPSTDIEGNPRTGTWVDMGAYEYVP